MALKFNNNNVEKVIYNGVEVNKVIKDGVVVYEKHVEEWHTIFEGSIVKSCSVPSTSSSNQITFTLSDIGATISSANRIKITFRLVSVGVQSDIVTREINESGLFYWVTSNTGRTNAYYDIINTFTISVQRLSGTAKVLGSITITKIEAYY